MVERGIRMALQQFSLYCKKCGYSALSMFQTICHRPNCEGEMGYDE